MASFSENGFSDLNFDENEEVNAVLHILFNSFENNFVEAHENLEKCGNIARAFKAEVKKNLIEMKESFTRFRILLHCSHLFYKNKII